MEAHSADHTFDLTIHHCTLYVDSSSNRQGSGAGLVLKTPKDTTIKYAIRFQFQASNNEAFMMGLRLAKTLGAERLTICNDSQLVVNQVITEFEARDESMAAYLVQTRRLLDPFNAYQIRQIPKYENNHVDALSRLASAIDDRAGRHLPVEVLARRSTIEDEVNVVRQNPSWMDPIHAHLANGTLPTDKTEAKAIQCRSARYLLLQNDLYRSSHSLRLLRCVTPQRGDYILREIHECRVVTIRDPDLWPSKLFGKAIIGQLSTLTLSGSCKNATSANASSPFQSYRLNHSPQ
ncbi:unnamed protein product [Prunus armeniaca]